MTASRVSDAENLRIGMIESALDAMTAKAQEHDPPDGWFDLLDWNVAEAGVEAALAAMDTGRPSQDEFEAALDHLMNICEGNGRLMETPCNQWGAPNEDELKGDEVDAARRAVLIAAGYGEDE